MAKEGTDTFTALFTAGDIGAMRLENRLVMTAMGNSLAGNEGVVTDAMIDYYAARARGGVGLIVTQFASVTAGESMPYNLNLYDDSFIPGLKRLVDALHEHGTKACIQLMHPGMLLLVLRSIPKDMTVKVPSITPRMSSDVPFEVVEEKNIERYITDFTEAARRVKETGADAVELHACHGCLVSTFLSTATNLRTDRYGGSVENRARFAREVIEAMRNKLGTDFPIIARINGSDDVEGGITASEAVQQAVILESAGADAISVSCGLEFWSSLMAPPYLAPDGVNVPVAEQVKKAVKVPVIAAGKVTPELAEQIISDGEADFAGMGRPLLADPELPNKLRDGHYEDIGRCLYCNGCMNTVWRSCPVNPFLLREATFPPEKAEHPKKVLVAGGGPAGLQAALLLAIRGHKVSLYEKGRQTGGQWRIASMVPDKGHFTSLTDRLRRELERYGVPVATGTEVTRELVNELKPDVVVVATGAVPLTLDVPGAEQPHVLQANDVLEGKVQTKGRVAVIGGRSLALETAIVLAEQGKEAFVVSHSGIGGKRGPDEKLTYRALMKRLVELRIPLYLSTTVLEITGTGVVVRMEKEILALPADTVLQAVGVEPVDTLAKELEGTVPEVYTVGDCVQPGNAAQATSGAARLALKI